MAVPVLENTSVGDSGGSTATTLTITSPTGIDPESVVFDHSSADDLVGWRFHISGADETTPIHLTGTISSTSGGISHTASSLTTTLDDCLIIAFLGGDGADMMPFGINSGTGWPAVIDDEADSGSAGNSATACVTYITRDLASQGASNSVQFSSSVSDGSARLQFAVAPGAGDIEIALVSSDDNGASNTWSTETGWTQFFTGGDASSDVKIAGYWRVATLTGGDPTLTGTPDAQVATLVGTLTADAEVSGTPDAQVATLAGTLTLDANVSGAPGAQSATLAGTLTVDAEISGSFTAQVSVLAGTLAADVDVSGTPDAQAAALAGTLTVDADVGGSFAAQAAAIVGTLSLGSRTVSGAPDAQSATMTGTLTVDANIGGTMNAQSATVSGILGDLAIRGSLVIVRRRRGARNIRQ